MRNYIHRLNHEFMERIYLFVILLFVQVIYIPSKAQTITESNLSQELMQISDSISTYQDIGNYTKVLSFCESGIMLLSKNNLTETPYYCWLCLVAGESSVHLGNYYVAKPYYYIAFLLDELGHFGVGVYSAIEKKAKEDVNIIAFRELLTLAKSDTIYLNELVTDPYALITKLNDTALEYRYKGEYLSALDCFEMEKNLIEALGEFGSDIYLSIIPIEIQCLTEMSNYNVAKTHSDYYLNLVRIFKSENSVEYAQGLSIKADIEAHLGIYSKAIELYEESISLIDNIKGQNNMNYINCLRRLGETYQQKDNNPLQRLAIELKAEKLLTLAIDATVYDKAYNLSILSDIYDQIGENKKSLIYAERAVCLLEFNNQIQSSEYATFLNTLASAQIANSLYDEAIITGEKAVKIFSQVERNVLEDFAFRMSLNILSQAYFESGNINKAISILEPLLLDNYPDDEYKLASIQTMITYCQRAGYENMIKIYSDKSLNLAEKIGGKKSKLYALALFFAADCQEKNGDALLMLQEAANIILEKFGENNDDYIRIQKAITLIKKKKITVPH